VSREIKQQIISIAAGVIYGFMVRGYIKFAPSAGWATVLLEVMSVGFVIIVPFAMGYMTVGIRASSTRVSIAQRIFLPWLTVFLSLLGCEAVAWEGSICIIMIAPIALLFGSAGGLTAGAVVRVSQPEVGAISIAIVALLPFLVGPAEHRFPVTPDVRTIESDVIINSSLHVIWKNIERVRAINPADLPVSWNRRIGFPRPIEATLSHEGLGGVRHATFAGNVLFVETIDEWDSVHRLGFSIRADTKSIPPTTLDEHVTVGGPYFDVLRGEYVLEPVNDGATRLRLISTHRVSTDFNWYAHLWTDAVMRDVQRSILYVVKNRCETEGGLPQPSAAAE
jgi:hypothetical protein